MNQPSLFTACRSMLVRDLVLAMRRRADVLTTLFFFLIVVSLFPLGVGPETKTLKEIGAGVIWVAALLASMLSLGRLFADDYQDGTLEQILLLPHPLSLLVLSKILAHWLVSGLPLVLFSPLLGLQLGLDLESIQLLMLTLLMGTPVLSLLGAVGAALTLGLRGGGVLVSLLVLPLYIPVLIFGAMAVDVAVVGLDNGAHLSLLGVFVTLSVLLCPLATATALRISLE
ncbi:MAG: heme exporter protein CcmB [Gammaproteobacteria bacterium]|nr:heme exporter protein CcmB [Gammaproteobacteria bacterium]MDH5800832.1 heme exporter protein CcmB [Gammaproteobacteria bacterium]